MTDTKPAAIMPKRWRRRSENTGIVEDENGRYVAHAEIFDAPLIASAPDLLSALKLAILTLRAADRHGAADALETVVRKAEGGAT